MKQLAAKAVLFSLGLSCLLVPGSRQVGVTWDEPIYLESAHQIVEWLTSGDLSDASMTRHLEASQWADVHPALPKWAGTTTMVLFHDLVGDLVAYRMANMLLVSLAAALCFVALSRRFANQWIGLLTTLCWVALPRVAGQAMLGDTDSTLMALSLPAALAGERAAATGSTRWSVICGLLCGACMATKFIGLAVPATIFLWAYLYHRHQAARLLFWTPVVAPIAFVLLNPQLWHDPMLRTLEFLTRSSSRHLSEPHVGYIFGNFFTSTPWHYPLVYLLATTPTIALLLALIGLGIVLRQRLRDPFAGLCAMMALAPMLVVLAPTGVAYDGVRLFLSSGLFLGLLAAWALERWWLVLRRPLVLVVLLGGLTLPMLLAHPFGLSYYAPQVGGLAGASRLGLELTYWWDAANPAFHRRANLVLPDDARVALFPSDSPLQAYYREQRLLLGEIVAPEESDHMVVLCRPACTNPRLLSFVRRIYPEPEILLAYPNEHVPFVLLLRRSGDGQRVPPVEADPPRQANPSSP